MYWKWFSSSKTTYVGGSASYRLQQLAGPRFVTGKLTFVTSVFEGA